MLITILISSSSIYLKGTCQIAIFYRPWTNTTEFASDPICSNGKSTKIYIFKQNLGKRIYNFDFLFVLFPKNLNYFTIIYY